MPLISFQRTKPGTAFWTISMSLAFGSFDRFFEAPMDLHANMCFHNTDGYIF